MKTASSIIFKTLLLCGFAQNISAGILDEKGHSHDWADYQGRIVVLEWVNFNCPFVKKHYDSGHIQTLQKKYTPKNIVWLTIQSTEPGRRGYLSAPALSEKKTALNATPTAILLDEKGLWAKHFKIEKLPSIVILNTSQDTVYRGAIDDTPGFLPEETKEATNYIEETLNALIAKKKLLTKHRPPYGCSLKTANPEQ